MNYRKKGGADGEVGNRVSLGWHEGGRREVCSGGCEAVDRGWMQGGCEAADGGSRCHPTPRSWAGSLHAANPPHTLHPS